ncbi:hypothetical protein RxyAA322_13870 [Rubrobacter xylanophilus]|uniref:MOSC domain-containing protein n=1 Tax=Rubrobacter xylanophilus TaxID=49319 RepID=A0A510HLR6_9ACTN|nr:MOSC domain-containing protein [Rubrobacter xylanophilus]BBL79533.1 hypothetical protein RxyAA322_13870 [Rubrobacter xylanophilus]
MPVTGAVWLGWEGFAGDEQADRENHGGPEKAALVCPAEHYVRWREMLGREIGPAAFGENLSTRSLTEEEEVCVGDVCRLGGAVVQVSQPRQPCYKPAWRFGVRDLAALTLRSGMTGFCLRVLEEGRRRGRPDAPGTALAVGHRLRGQPPHAPRPARPGGDPAPPRGRSPLGELARRPPEAPLKRGRHTGRATPAALNLSMITCHWAVACRRIWGRSREEVEVR